MLKSFFSCGRPLGPKIFASIESTVCPPAAPPDAAGPNNPPGKKSSSSAIALVVISVNSALAAPHMPSGSPRCCTGLPTISRNASARVTGCTEKLPHTSTCPLEASCHISSCRFLTSSSNLS